MRSDLRTTGAKERKISMHLPRPLTLLGAAYQILQKVDGERVVRGQVGLAVDGEEVVGLALGLVP